MAEPSAAARDIDLARRALATGTLTARQEQVCRARLADPDANWELIAHRTGLTEDEVAAAFTAAVQA